MGREVEGMVLLLIRDKNPACSIEGGNTHALMDHWIGTVHTLGINDSKVTYNHPLTTIYQKNGRKTYAAYKYGKEPLNVAFSDGKKHIAKPGALTTALPTR